MSTHTARLAHRPWWPWVRRLATWAFFGLIAWLLVNQALAIDWQEVFDAVRALPAATLLLAGALAASSFALYSTYDLLGRHLTRHPLSAGTVMGVTFISYAFNLNLGSLVGGVAFRYRLYSRLELSNGTLTRVLVISMLTNRLGSQEVARVVICVWPQVLPRSRSCRGTRGRRAIRRGRCASSSLMLPVPRPTSLRASWVKR